MRITLSIDDDAMEIARNHAATNGITLGKAVSMLIKRAVAGPHVFHQSETGLFVYDSQGGHVITSQMVKDLQDED